MRWCRQVVVQQLTEHQRFDLHCASLHWRLQEVMSSKLKLIRRQNVQMCATESSVYFDKEYNA